jgi:hypothetical protein
MTTASYETILTCCNDELPSFVYVAIGCAQWRYPPGKHFPQEYPPFLASWPGPKVCVLIDPELESPPRCFTDMGEEVEHSPMQKIADTTFALRRMPFCFPGDFTDRENTSEEDVAFLLHLCRFVLRTSAKLIVHDFTGRAIQPYYPFSLCSNHEERVHLMNSVLFDFTYTYGSCFVDFSKVSLLLDPLGNFVQPAFLPLRCIHVPSILRIEIEERYNIIITYVYHYYRIQRGEIQSNVWCSPEEITKRTARLCIAYNIPNTTSMEGVRTMLREALFDFSSVSEHYMTEDETGILLDDSSGQFRNAMKMLRDLSYETSGVHERTYA